MLIVFFVYIDPTPDLHGLNRRRTRPCSVVEASMGRRRAVRSTWRDRSRPRIQACKDVLLR